VEEVGEGNLSEDEGEKGIEGWERPREVIEEKRGKKRCHLQADPTYQMIYLGVSIRLTTPRIRNHSGKLRKDG